MRRWLVGRVRRVASLLVCLTIICLVLLLANHLLKRTGLGRLLGHGWSGQKREMVQYYPHAGPGRQAGGGVEKAAKGSLDKTNSGEVGRRIAVSWEGERGGGSQAACVPKLFAS